MVSVGHYIKTVVVLVRHNLGKFPILNRRSVRQLCVKCAVTNLLRRRTQIKELSDMHFAYGLADSNAVVTRRLYQERYPVVPIAAFVNMGILHLMLPTGENQDLRLLK
jgi:hypothetical protein